MLSPHVELFTSRAGKSDLTYEDRVRGDDRWQPGRLIVMMMMVIMMMVVVVVMGW